MNNNPVTHVDPNGDLAWAVPILITMAKGAAIGVASNGIGNLTQGNNFFDGAGRAALFGAASGALSLGVGELFGEIGSFGNELLRASAHGITQAGVSLAQGGNGIQGFLSGAIGSGIGSAIEVSGLSGTELDIAVIGGAGLGGGIGSAIAGGDFWQGFGIGATVAGLNHIGHRALSGGGDPPTKEEIAEMDYKLSIALRDGEINLKEYSLMKEVLEHRASGNGNWSGILKQAFLNNKWDIALSMIPGGRALKVPFKHGFKYARRVRVRGVQDPVAHNFPYSFDDVILSTKPIPRNNGYRIFRKAGTMNGKSGVFEIGVTKGGVFDHRFFRPN